MDACLGAAREDCVGGAATDDLGRLADGVRPGRARGHGRVVRAAEAQRYRELAAARVDEHARDERRGDAIGPPRAQDLGLLGDADHPADGGAEQDADARRLVRAVEARVGDGLARGREREQDVPLELAHLLRRGDRARIEVLHLGGDAHREAARVERADEVDAALSGDRRAPGRGRVVSDRRHRAEPRDDDPPHQRKVTVTRAPCRATLYGLRRSRPIAQARSDSKSQVLASSRTAPPAPLSRRLCANESAVLPGRKWMTKCARPRRGTARPEPHSASGPAT